MLTVLTGKHISKNSVSITTLYSLFITTLISIYIKESVYTPNTVKKKCVYCSPYNNVPTCPAKGHQSALFLASVLTNLLLCFS